MGRPVKHRQEWYFSRCEFDPNYFMVGIPGIQCNFAEMLYMKFSIVTPSFRNSEWLKLCIASVADQEGVDLEHIVQDACSDDGTQKWLPYDRRVRAFIEKDLGMYDAINRGYRRSRGEILAHLNCDEQYLPGALRAVQAFFEQHPQIEVALAGTIVVDGNGKYTCHRHSMVPKASHVWFRFPVLTSS